MKSYTLKSILSEITRMPAGTVSGRVQAAQNAGLVTVGGRGRYSGADLDDGDRVNGLLCCLFDVEAVKRMRRYPCVNYENVTGNSQRDELDHTNLGCFLDSAMAAMRSGKLESEVKVGVEFYDTSSVWVGVRNPAIGLPSFEVLTFNHSKEEYLIAHVTRIDSEAFRRLAVD